MFFLLLSTNNPIILFFQELWSQLCWLKPHKLRLLCSLQFWLWTSRFVERRRKAPLTNLPTLKITLQKATPMTCSASLISARLYTWWALLCYIKIPVRRTRNKLCQAPNTQGWRSSCLQDVSEWTQSFRVDIILVFEQRGRIPIFPNICSHVD